MLPGRTTAVLVASVIEVDSSISLDPFIDTANELVTEFCGSVTTYTTYRLELIERWLAAHFYAIRDPRSASESAGPVSASYQFKVDLGLKQTTYGQQVLVLDTAGGLSRWDTMIQKGLTQRKVGVLHLGPSGEVPAPNTYGRFGEQLAITVKNDAASDRSL
jgi:hypothetical protein